MASGSQKQKASRWGFLQQAVASVESRLDTILAEEDNAPTKVLPPPAQPAKEVVPNRPSAEVSRSGASTPTNERLQARLAQAMAKKNMGRSESPAPTQSEAADGQTIATEVKSSMDSGRSQITAETTLEGDGQTTGIQRALEEAPVPLSTAETEPVYGYPVEDKASLEIPPKSTGSAKASADVPRESSNLPSVRESEESQAMVPPSQLHAHLEAEASQQKLQEELNEYKERIDTLQNKLKRLAQQASKSASDEVKVCEPGTVEKQLAEKDKAFALLTEEYVSMQKAEMTFRQNIKKLRVQTINSEKTHTETKQQLEKASRHLRAMEDRARTAESHAKRAEQNLTINTQTTSSFEAIKKERDALYTTLADIKAQLSRANLRAENAESRATTDQLDASRKQTASLQDDLASLKIEHELSEEKLRREIKDLHATLEREKEHGRAIETEMLNEQASLESKLESFRARAEEASSSDHGDVQAKLLRQIETLQSQYAAASQNWQGIESSLLSRITNVEKERDEVLGREVDVRRKLRDTTSKLKRAERELEDAQNRLPEVEKQLGEAEEEGQRYQRKISVLESDVAELRKELEGQKSAERELKQRMEEEKAKWLASSQSQAHQRVDSPVTSMRKGMMGAAVDPYDHRPVSRRSSLFPAPVDSPSRQQSQASLKALANGSGIPETPSIMTSNDPDEYFNNVPPTPASQGHTHSPRGLHDLVSTSTVGAGPSVQLVERMSANVRRLESEKAASKDEIARLTTQRDESRQDVVDLMREVEEKRDVAKRLDALEEEHKALSKRHQTTLEMLGEKSEQVEELKLDVVDVKQMYRHLADTMGK